MKAGLVLLASLAAPAAALALGFARGRAARRRPLFNPASLYVEVMVLLAVAGGVIAALIAWG